MSPTWNFVLVYWVHPSDFQSVNNFLKHCARSLFPSQTVEVLKDADDFGEKKYLYLEPKRINVVKKLLNLIMSLI